MSILSHVSLGTNDYKRAKAFYDAVLGTLQIKRLMDFDVTGGYGRTFPEFWIGNPHDGGTAATGNGTHVCFNAATAPSTPPTTTPPSCVTWMVTRSRPC